MKTFELGFPYSVTFDVDGKEVTAKVASHDVKNGTLLIYGYEVGPNYGYYAVPASEAIVKCHNYGNQDGTHCPNNAEEFVLYHGLLCHFCARIETDPAEIAYMEAEAKDAAEFARICPWG